jgi:hypothetical protein
MPETKINITRFCDLQGVGEFDRAMMEKKYKGLVALYEEWYTTLTKAGFTLHPLKKDFCQAPPPPPKPAPTTEKKQ